MGPSVRPLWLPAWFALLLVGLAGPASAVTIDWVTVGDPDNPCDPQPPPPELPQGCLGAVGVTYRISATEVTNLQYAEFLNAKALDDPLGLYNTRMGSIFPFDQIGFGPITRSGTSGNYLYTVSAGYEDKPVGYVSFYDSLRFANWLHNGQGSGDTETGAYTLLGGTAVPSNGGTVRRNAWATVFLPSRSQWYKAAYYDPVTASYFDYPAGTDTPTVCALPGPTANTANCNFATAGLADVGSYTGSASPYGTFDQGGNAREWNEARSGRQRGTGGGDPISGGSGALAAWHQQSHIDPTAQADSLYGFVVGFRVASRVPEPSSHLLVMTSLLVLSGLRRRRGWRSSICLAAELR